jgi:SAM-dependent methyltransferase
VREDVLEEQVERQVLAGGGGCRIVPPGRMGRGGDQAMGDWIAFWDSEHSIYVNARHRDVHYRRIAQDIRAHLPAGAAVLDYGCGEALHADIVAETAGRLILCEAAPMVRAALGRRFGKNPKIEVRAPEEIAALPSGSIDVVVLHSVAQYLSPKELDELLVLFRRLLRANGVFILGDVIPPHVSALGDAAALLHFAARNGFLGAALIGLGRTFVSDYWRLRSNLGLARYAEAAVMEKLARAGFLARRAPANIGHNPARMTFLARPK